MSGPTNPTEEHFVKGQWGFDGSVWRKLNLTWGYHDRWVQYVYGVAAGAGNAVANMVAVPTGYVYVLETIAFTHDAGAAKVCAVDLILGAIGVPIIGELTWASGATRCWQGRVTLKAADFVRLTVFSPGDGKWGYLWLSGYAMKVT